MQRLNIVTDEQKKQLLAEVIKTITSKWGYTEAKFQKELEKFRKNHQSSPICTEIQLAYNSEVKELQLAD